MASNSTELSDIYLFNPDILKNIDISKRKSNLSPEITPSSPGEGLVLRPLSVLDFDKGYIELLANLTKVGVVTKEMYVKQFKKMQRTPNTYYIAVIEDVTKGKVVASTTLYLEYKFIHGTTLRGRIEDVVVDTEFRGKQLGKLLIECLVKMGEDLSCYKISLDCDPKLKTYYEKFGFVHPEDVYFLAVRFFD